MESEDDAYHHNEKSEQTMLNTSLIVKEIRKKFTQKIQVERHEAQIHSTEIPFQSNTCDKKFKSEFSWKRHQDNFKIIHHILYVKFVENSLEEEEDGVLINTC